MTNKNMPTGYTKPSNSHSFWRAVQESKKAPEPPKDISSKRDNLNKDVDVYETSLGWLDGGPNK